MRMGTTLPHPPGYEDEPCGNGATSMLSVPTLPFSSILAAASIPERDREFLPGFSKNNLTWFPSSQAGEASWDGPERDAYLW